MRLEEIAHRLSTAVTVNDFREIEDDIRNHIVERDEPVTREWCEANADMFRACGEEHWCLGSPGEEHLYVTIRGGVVNAWSDIGVGLCIVTTRGQLLDLLSGLGVRK